MSTIKSSAENLTLNADGSGNDVLVQSNGSTKAIVTAEGNVIIGASSFDQGGFSGSATGINVHGVSPLILCKETDTNIRGYVGVAGSDMYVVTPDARNLYLGTNDTARIAIDPTGAVTMPAQPAFSTYIAGNQNNIAINGQVKILFDSEVFDQNADFNTSTNTFTAPVTGKYFLALNLVFGAPDAAAGFYQFAIVTSNRTFVQTNTIAGSTDPTYWTWNYSILADMDAGDTAYINYYQNVGTAQVDARGGNETSFSGYLVA